MHYDNRKVALIGTGLVGMSYAYALLNQAVCDELVLIDIDEKRAQGEAMDLNHGLAFSGSNMKIYAGHYSDCAGADIVAICAGVAQKPGETRLDLLQRNTEVFKSIIGPVVESGFNGDVYKRQAMARHDVAIILDPIFPLDNGGAQVPQYTDDGSYDGIKPKPHKVDGHCYAACIAVELIEKTKEQHGEQAG